MAVQITWQPDPNGQSELWLVESGQPSNRLFAVTPNQMATAQPLVQGWADQADSVPEFLEMLHLEDLIDLDTLRRMLAEHVPLYRIWSRLREFCREAGDIGEFPASWIAIGSAEEAPHEMVVHLPELQVVEALAAWRRFEDGDPQALSEANLAMVVAALGGLAGQRLGLPWEAVMHFGDWLTGLITGWLISHGNEEQLWQLENLAAQAAAGGPQHIGPACYNPEVWEVYRPAIAAVVRALREGI
ncbi:MAG: hypothetical protein ACRERE_01165 [Candidatus Entotheonellia bacterium]